MKANSHEILTISNRMTLLSLIVQIYTFKKHYASKKQRYLYFLPLIEGINIKKTKPINLLNNNKTKKE